MTTQVHGDDQAERRRFTKKHLIGGAAAAVLLLGVGAAAGAKDPKDSSEFRAEAQARAEAEDRIGNLEDQLADTRADADDVAADLEEAEQALSSTEGQLADVQADLDMALADIEALRQQYDPQVQAERQAAWDAEVEAACAAASADIDSPVDTFVTWSADWERIGTEADLIAQVDACAAPVRNQTAEERLAAEMASCVEIDVDEVVRNPDATTGTCYVVHGQIWQFDSRTGPCTFLAAMDDQTHQYNYQYGEDGLFASADPDACPELDGINVDDHVKIWARSVGSFSYETAIGGSNAVPAFQIVAIELIRAE